MAGQEIRPRVPMALDLPSRAVGWICSVLGLLIAAHAAYGQPEKTVYDRLRAQEWYLPTADSGTELYVTEIGQGDTVIVLHGGWGAEHSYLVDAVEGLEDQFHFVFYDQRGSLRSPIPDHQADSLISVRKHLQDLETLRMALGSERMTLMAHSMGSMLAMLYLHEYPEHVKRLVLLGAIPPPPRPPRTPKDSLLYQGSEALADSFKNRAAIDAEMEEEGLDKEDLSAKEQSFRWKINYAGVNIYYVKRWRQKKGGRAFYDSASAEAVTGESIPDSTVLGLRNALRDFDGPVPVILGDHDYVDMKGRIWQTIAEQIPNVQLYLIERAGHATWIDRPEKFRKYLQQALQATAQKER